MKKASTRLLKPFWAFAMAATMVCAAAGNAAADLCKYTVNLSATEGESLGDKLVAVFDFGALSLTNFTGMLSEADVVDYDIETSALTLDNSNASLKFKMELKEGEVVGADFDASTTNSVVFSIYMPDEEGNPIGDTNVIRLTPRASSVQTGAATVEIEGTPTPAPPPCALFISGLFAVYTFRRLMQRHHL